MRKYNRMLASNGHLHLPNFFTNVEIIRITQSIMKIVVSDSFTCWLSIIGNEINLRNEKISIVLNIRNCTIQDFVNACKLLGIELIERIAAKLMVRAKVRYWGDSQVSLCENDDYFDDTKGLFIPCRSDEEWIPMIDLSTGVILNWNQRVSARIHYKVCDEGTYTLLDKDNNTVSMYSGYVPYLLRQKGDDYDSDCIVLIIDKNGKIKNFDGTILKDFF